jgi:hypothetical protein
MASCLLGGARFAPASRLACLIFIA